MNCFEGYLKQTTNQIIISIVIGVTISNIRPKFFENLFISSIDSSSVFKLRWILLEVILFSDLLDILVSESNNKETCNKSK